MDSQIYLSTYRESFSLFFFPSTDVQKPCRQISNLRSFVQFAQNLNSAKTPSEKGTTSENGTMKVSDGQAIRAALLVTNFASTFCGRKEYAL